MPPLEALDTEGISQGMAQQVFSKTCSRPRPFRLSTGGRGAHNVLELPAGSLERSGLKGGDAFSCLPADEDVR
jgi:uncharacterized membrane protein (UPF0127 family)